MMWNLLQIVPGYYLRRNTDGFIENSTCVNNTASEHFMVERLILDDLLHWVVDYKVIALTTKWYNISSESGLSYSHKNVFSIVSYIIVN